MTQPANVPATAYLGPVKTTELVIAGRPIRLVRPADPDRLLDADDVRAWNKADDYMPYWAYLWPGAFLLAEAVVREPQTWPEGTAALEIGCGLGLAGLAGLSRGLTVTFTDYDATPLEFVDRSARANGFAPPAYSTRRLDWREPPAETFTVVLGADVLYEARLVPLVARLLAGVLAPGGLALIAGPYRLAAEAFPDAARAAGLTCDREPVTATSAELGDLSGHLDRVRRPAV